MQRAFANSRANMLIVLIVATPAFADDGPHPASHPVCNKDQHRTGVPTRDEVSAHRQFAVPFRIYPFGTAVGGEWGFDVTVRVNEAGSVTCYLLKSKRNQPVPPNESRTRLLDNGRNYPQEARQ